ncbi:cobalt-precorrin-5B (C(1))-methyltransferase [Anoxybacillus flavithermus]|uniref:Cobalt-precorrin-5B C(1)-methyltransferase n=1 Tax=Anoxybacillus flavithermus TaxID=33934 RepID=A0A2G5RT23_9BACL|nr:MULTISPECIES: cobalt-precorrin-5B (C(1))-methyltransferase [Anoxybacillus]KFZ43807.1 cobalt-precorrin-6A synthase [Anoxybacillus sp. KU2-6(11)]PIC05887.1 cobalt-precorrin-5B (C(1))-methyltransferase [Anoxybacillus flavithermus]
MEKEKLREGYTTGACATAATKAALCALITGVKQTEATIMLPIGREVTLPVVACEVNQHTASATVVKDAGDDPDVTHGASIIATVSWTDEGIYIDGGEGVGRVTKPGLPIPVGEAAINPVPRQMMMDVANELMTKYGIKRGVRIIISVPNGEEIAKKTLNGRLGIIGGISILGTRGIVVPFSTSAYRASIVRALEVAIACGCNHVVITTGGRSEKYAMKQYSHLPEEAFIEMGDFVGFTLKQCKRLSIKTVSLVGMMGKFSKVAQGVMMVHSKSAPVDFHFLSEVARQSGAPAHLTEAIQRANTASQVGDMMYEAGYSLFFDLLCDYCCQHALREVGGGMTVETTLYTLQGQLLGRAMRNDESNEINRDRS